MARPSPAVSHPRAIQSALSRYRSPDDPALLAAKRDTRAEVLIEHVERVVNEFPPLTDAQVERIAALLRAGGAT